MTARDFVYWLQGYFEIHGKAEALTAAQSDMIQRHLALVFKHEIDPQAGPPEVQQKLNEIHEGIQKLGRPAPGGGLIRC